jgi:group I intron endonuclease
MNCGIYCYKNLINNKIYVGKSKDIKRRIRQHERGFRFELEEQLKNKDAILLWRAVKKYGRDNFIVEILEICEDKELTAKEDYYIEKLCSHFLKNGYNILLGSGDKMSGENHPFYGKHHTPESIVLITEASRKNHGMKGKNHTEETKKLISEKMKEFYKNNPNSKKKVGKPWGHSKRLEVELLLKKGLSPKEISSILGISASTVYRIRNKNNNPR